MIRICDEYKEVVGRPTRFLQMIHDPDDAVEDAKKVILEEPIPDGFTELYLRNRLDLTVEYVVDTHPEFDVFFDAIIREKARQ